MRIILSLRAKKDFRDHYTYIGLREEGSAERFLNAVDRTFALLAERPDIGSTRLWRDPALRGIRAWPVSSSLSDLTPWGEPDRIRVRFDRFSRVFPR